MRFAIEVTLLLFALTTIVVGMQPLAHAAPDNRYCGPRGTVQFGASKDGPAALPITCMYTALIGTPSRGRILQVAAGANLQSALNNAQCGDTIQLQAGATFTGFFTLPARSCDANHWITIRTSAPSSSLPPEGTRITPCYAGVSSLPGRPALNCVTTRNVLAKIVYPGSRSSGPLGLAPGANHYRLLGLEITRSPGTGGVSTLFRVRMQGKADHIVLDRVDTWQPPRRHRPCCASERHDVCRDH